jgi:hypothetical protein
MIDMMIATIDKELAMNQRGSESLWINLDGYVCQGATGLICYFDGYSYAPAVEHPILWHILFVSSARSARASLVI